MDMERTPFYDGRTPLVQMRENQMRDAERRRDDVAYVESCAVLGLEPGNQDLHDQGLVAIMLAERKRLPVEDIQTSDEPSQEETRDATKINYAKFWELAQKKGLNYVDIFVQTDDKARVLKASGYTHLIGKGGVAELIEKTKPTRVGKVYRDVYGRAEKKFARVE